jgi:hypothetical protein
MRKIYELKQDKLPGGPGGPPLIKEMPSREEFSFLHKANLVSKLGILKIEADKQLLFHGKGAFHSIDEIKRVYGHIFPEPSNIKRYVQSILICFCCMN